MRTIKAAVHWWLVHEPLLGRRLLAALSWLVHDLGNRNLGSYGADQFVALTGSWRRFRTPVLRRAAAALSRQLDYYGDLVFWHQIWDPIAGVDGKKLRPLRDVDDPDLQLADGHLSNRSLHPTPSASHATFSIITPYFRHFDHFKDCARSVAKAMRRIGPSDAEWIVVNDDPSCPSDRLLSLIPSTIQSRTSVITNPKNLGNTATLNAAITASRHDWVVFLDCDDVLDARALSVLGRYIVAFPHCRYFTSSMVDIDSEGQFLRYQPRDVNAAQLFTHGMFAGHLKAVRRDAFDELGLLNAQFDGCQDYEFALRVSVNEPICFIPEFLYRYRWHAKTQTLSGLEKQLSRARQIRRLYADFILGKSGILPARPSISTNGEEALRSATRRAS